MYISGTKKRGGGCDRIYAMVWLYIPRLNTFSCKRFMVYRVISPAYNPPRGFFFSSQTKIIYTLKSIRLRRRFNYYFCVHTYYLQKHGPTVEQGCLSPPRLFRPLLWSPMSIRWSDKISGRLGRNCNATFPPNRSPLLKLVLILNIRMLCGPIA